MLPPTILEESKVGQFIYRRYSVRSKVLEKSTHFGTLNAEEAKEKADHFLYMFHGGNGDDRQLVQEGIIGAIQGRALDLLVNRNIQIVLPFIGTSFLHDFPGDSSRAFAKHFFDELIPGLESSSPAFKNRYVYGVSMGGFAALSAFFRRPQLFAGVGAQMPALFTMDYTNPSEVEAFVKRTGTPKEAIEFLLSLLKPEFVDLADYKGCDPIALAKRIPSRILAGKTLCFDVGSADSFGCFEGADALHEILQDQNVPHEYEKAAGGLHDVNFLLSRVSSLLANVLK